MRYLLVLGICLLIEGCATTQPIGNKIGNQQLQTVEEIKKDLTSPKPQIYQPKSIPTLNPIYIVEKGDSLWLIAGKIYGDNFLWPSLSAGNKLDHVDCLTVGTRLQYKKNVEKSDKQYIKQAWQMPAYVKNLCQ